MVNAFGIGSLVGFAGRRWRVTAVDDRAKVLEVVAHSSGKIPKFDRLASEPVHDRLVQEMRTVFLDGAMPAYLDSQAADLLAEGRLAFHKMGLDARRFLQAGNDTHVLAWRGTAVTSILAVLLSSAGLECEAHDIGVTVANASAEDVLALLAKTPVCPPIEDLAGFVQNLRHAKYDDFLTDDLLRSDWAARNANYRNAVTQVLQELSA